MRVKAGVGKQHVGQWLQAGLAGDQALGAPLLFKGQVKVFQLLLGGCRINGRTQRGRELALLIDGRQHGRTAVFQFAQVAQPGLQRTQRDVVQALGGLFAVTGNEGHGGATVQQLHRCLHLARRDVQLGRNLQKNLVQMLGPAGPLGKAGEFATGGFWQPHRGLHQTPGVQCAAKWVSARQRFTHHAHP